MNAMLTSVANPMSAASIGAALDALPVRLKEATADSREARDGFLFLAYPGLTRDGRDFIAEAIARGVSAVAYEADGFEWNTAWRVPHLPVHGLKAIASAIGAHVYAHPTNQLRMIGVTGTNGKTSVSQWIAQALDATAQPALGANPAARAAVIGTIGNGLVGALEPSNNTTPDAVELQRWLRRVADDGAGVCVMEVSSHGLNQMRVAAVPYEIGVFTNLTRDHLDYHGTMEAYGEAKAALFESPRMQCAVINVDDPFGRLLAARCVGRGLKVIRTSCNGGSKNGDLIASELSVTSAGISFVVTDGRALSAPRSTRVESDILGAFNIANLLSVIGTLLAMGFSLTEAVARISALKPVAGRMQTLRMPNRPMVVVDYAHTPDALEKVLSTLAAVVPEGGRLIVVFGCGGNRDAGKRPLMGAIAARFADLVVVTSDNPRREDANGIIADILNGVASAPHRVVADRQQAIFEALNAASARDVVLIAGKGHEETQIIGETKFHFSDIEVAGEALMAWVSMANSR